MSVLPHEQPARVVIVDDTPDLRDLLRMALEGAEFSVVAEAGNGRDGVAMVELHQPDIVLLDLSMPVMDGLEALPLMRQACPGAAIAVLSGFDAAHLTQRALDAGADGYLQKGAPLKTVLEYVRTLRPGGASPVPHLSLAAPAAASPPPSGDDPLEDALVLAPFGVVALRDERDLTVLGSNAAARSLLGSELAPGTQFEEHTRTLAAMVGFHQHRDLQEAATFEVEVGEPLTGTLRRSAGRLLLYVEPADQTATRLRRAIATAAHEIRTPVTVIYGVAETLVSQPVPDDQRSRMLASMTRQVRVLDTITADLLTAAQIHRGTLRVQVERVRLRRVVEQVVADRPGVSLEIDDDPVVIADPIRLEQMLTNLLSNAEKYGAPPVTVRVHRAAAQVCIDVEDRGPGVPDDFRDQLFDEFSRAPGSAARGTGLGLYVVRTLAEAHGGTIRHRPNPSGGAIFTICLPTG